MKDYTEFCRLLFDLCDACERGGIDDEVNLLDMVALACEPGISSNDLMVMGYDFEHLRSLRNLKWPIVFRTDYNPGTNTTVQLLRYVV